MTQIIEPTAKTRLHRLPKRGSFERETIYRILDEGFVCHVGFIIDEQPFVIPTSYARVGDSLLIHGSAASRMMRAMAWEKDVCVTVTLVDGLVLARSAFHHSVNYRSVVIFGRAKIISDESEKLNSLKSLTEHIVPNRWQDVRPPTAHELKATTVLSLSLREASAKVRAGNPIDDDGDYDMNVWAGIIPLEMSAGEPAADPSLRDGIKVPSYVSDYRRKQ